jgi:hypothetical protein
MKDKFETTFRTFVSDFGGNFIPEDMTKRADFHFSADNVIAELKTLEEDARQEHGRRVQALYEDWARKRLVPFFYGTRQIELPKLPPSCQRDWLNVLLPPIENIVRDANRQIRTTKAKLGLSACQGLLLIANEGNLLHTTPDHYLKLVGLVANKRTTTGDRRFPEIDGVIYFSYRVPSKNEGLPFWAPGHLNLNDNHMIDFQERLKFGWYRYLSKTLNIPVGEILVDPTSRPSV